MLKTLTRQGMLQGVVVGGLGALIAASLSFSAIREFEKSSQVWQAQLAKAVVDKVVAEGLKTLDMGSVLLASLSEQDGVPNVSEERIKSSGLYGVSIYSVDGVLLRRMGGRDPVGMLDRMFQTSDQVRRGKQIWWMSMDSEKISFAAAYPMELDPPISRLFIVTRSLKRDWFERLSTSLGVPLVYFSQDRREDLSLFGRAQAGQNLKEIGLTDREAFLDAAQREDAVTPTGSILFTWANEGRSYRVSAAPLFSGEDLQPVGYVGILWRLDSLMALRRSWLQLQWLGIALSMAIGVVLGFLFWRSSGRLVTDLLKERAGWDGTGLLQKVQGRRDPLSRMARMMADSRSSAGDVVKRANELGMMIWSSAKRQSACAEQMTSATEELSAMVEQASRAVSHEAEMVQHLSDVAKLITEKAIQAEKGTEEGVRSSHQTLDAARRGGEETDRSMQKMEDITQAIARASEEVKVLSETTEEIASILNSITDIAAQTRLLALNAEIEATRAGTEGREFSVVAEEVENLADESAKAVLQITELVENIQQRSGRASEAMRSGMKLVEEGRSIVGETRVAIGDVVRAVQSTSDLVTRMAESAKKQLSSAAEASQVVSELASVAEGNAAAMEEASASSEEQAASMEQVAESANELLASAHSLRTLFDSSQEGAKDQGDIPTPVEKEKGAEQEEAFPWEQET